MNDDDEPVGYKRPPKATRFQKGRSGNPKGRPKQARGLRTIVQAIAGDTITITENGVSRQISAIEGIIVRMRNAAIKGDPRAQKLFLDLMARNFSDLPEASVDQADTAAHVATMTIAEKQLTMIFYQMIHGDPDNVVPGLKAEFVKTYGEACAPWLLNRSEY